MKINLLISCCVLLSLISCSEPPEKKTDPAPRLVKALKIESNRKDFQRIYPARVSADQKVNLSFLVSGRLVELPIEEGQTLEKGQLVGQIDPKDYEIKVAQQKAKYMFAKITYERFEKLLPTEAISKAQYDEKKSLFDLEKANLDETEKALSDTRLLAPFKGVVASKFVDNFQHVQAKQKIISLQDIEIIELVFYIPEQELSQAQAIKKLETADDKKQLGFAEFNAMPNKKFPVFFKAISTEADPKTQNYEVKLTMDRPQQRVILPGMTANVTIEFKNDITGIQIPLSAVMVDAKGQYFVWKINPTTMTVSKYPVTAKQVTNDKVHITAGLDLGDQIVIAGVNYLKPAMKVKILTERIGR